MYIRAGRPARSAPASGRPFYICVYIVRKKENKKK